MARKLRSEAAAQAAQAATVETTEDRSSVASGAVTFIRVDSRRLAILSPSSEVWVGGTVDPEAVKGSLVRLEPPATATDEQVDGVKRELMAAGALAVRVAPKAAGAAVVAPAKERVAASASVREVVLGMVEEARVGDRDALRALIEEALASEGL